MQKTKKIFHYNIFIFILAVAVFIMYFLDNSKTWKIKTAFYLAIIACFFGLLTLILCYFIERKTLREYKINNYLFVPLEIDHYQDLRILMEQKNLSNTLEEKELLEKYKLLTHDLAKQNNHYIVYFNENPFALIKFKKDLKSKTCEVKIIYTDGYNFEKEIEIIMKKEGLHRI